MKMADERKRRHGGAEATESEDATAVAAVRRQRTETGEKESEEGHAGGVTAGDIGEDILAWLTDLDKESVRDLMVKLFEPTSPGAAPVPTSASGKVSFADDPRSLALQPSYITINTDNEETCGSSFSEAPSIMAGFDASGLAGVGDCRRLAAGGEDKSAVAVGEICEWGFLADDDGDDVLARFLGEGLL